jgi:hypothetical protein
MCTNFINMVASNYGKGRVKLLQKSDDKFIFELGFEEKDLLLEVIKLYPVLDPAYHKFSNSLDDEEASLSRNIFREDL